MHLSVYPWNNLQPSTPPYVLPYGEELISKFGWLNDFFLCTLSCVSDDPTFIPKVGIKVVLDVITIGISRVTK